MMKKLKLFFAAMVLGIAGAAQAQTASQQLFGMELPEIELPEASIHKTLPDATENTIDLKSRNLPQPGQHILGKDKFSSRVSAMQEHRKVLDALRGMKINIMESPEGGVYSYLEANYDGLGSHTRYGYIIEYQGPRLVMETFHAQNGPLSKWQMDAIASSVQRYGGHILLRNDHFIEFIRYVSKPTPRTTYNVENSRRDAERVRYEVENDLRRNGFEILFTHTSEKKTYDPESGRWWEYHYIHVVYLSIVD